MCEFREGPLTPRVLQAEKNGGLTWLNSKSAQPRCIPNCSILSTIRTIRLKGPVSVVSVRCSRNASCIMHRSVRVDGSGTPVPGDGMVPRRERRGPCGVLPQPHQNQSMRPAQRPSVVFEASHSTTSRQIFACTTFASASAERPQTVRPLCSKTAVCPRSLALPLARLVRPHSVLLRDLLHCAVLPWRQRRHPGPHAVIHRLFAIVILLLAP